MNTNMSISYTTQTQSERPKLAILTLDFLPQFGGVQKYLYEIAKRLDNTYQINIITPISGPLPDGTTMQKITPASNNAMGFWRSLHVLKPNRVIVGHAHPQLLLPAFFYTRANYATCTYGNDYLAAQKRWHHPLFNWLLARSRPLFTITQANANRLQCLGLSATHIVHPATDPTIFKPSPVPPPFPPILLTVSRLVPRKGIDLVLQALPSILSDFPDVKYRIVGDGPDRSRLQSLVQERNLQKTVSFLGKISDLHLLNEYQQSHIFVMPAREEEQAASMEGFGIVYLEASACGLPVIAGRSGGAMEAIQEGKTGYAVDPCDSISLVKTILKLLQNPEERLKMGLTGRKWVETEMNWERAAKQVMLALQEGEK